MSFDEVTIDVSTNERIVSQKTTVQRGISSLMGLINATSGCPHTLFFRPMARFHLPFADSYETTYRVASMYLLTQYFLNQAGKEIDLELAGLKRIYKDIQTIDQAMIDRLRVAVKKDVVINALTILDALAKLVPMAIEESLGEIHHLFRPYIDHISDLKGHKLSQDQNKKP